MTKKGINVINVIPKFKYFENLDGLRAIAAFSVIFTHIADWFNFPNNSLFYYLLRYTLAFGGAGGTLGVQFFFILSGFLITYLMFLEQSKNGSLNIIYFYIRRILRIWPLYYITLIAGFLFYPLICKLAGIDCTITANLFLYSIFAVNFDHIYNGAPGTGILGVQWSVAIEEQFYLLWPLFFYFFNKRTIFPYLLSALIVISECFYINNSNWAVGYYHLISNFRFLAFGGLLAYLCYFKETLIIYFLQKISKPASVAIYIICLSLIFFQKNIPNTFIYFKIFYHFIPLLFFGFVIVEQNFSNNSFFKIGSFKLLSWFGKISYGLYLTHMIAIYIVLGILPETANYILINIVVTILLTIIVSYVSYTYIELFFLNMKNKFSLTEYKLRNTNKENAKIAKCIKN